MVGNNKAEFPGETGDSSEHTQPPGTAGVRG